MKDITHRLESVKELLTIAKSKNIDVFGASTHKWTFDSPIDSSELTEIEKEFAIVLPEEYRSFLLTVTNGVAGPEHGLKPLRESVEYYVKQGYSDILVKAFPHTSDYYEHEDPSIIKKEKMNNHGELSSEELDKYLTYAYAGTIDICEMGCGYTYKLVITGPTRGSVWKNYSTVDEGMIPTGKTFLEWYEDWIKSVVAKNQ